MVSFREKLVKGLAERGIAVASHLADTPYDAILVIGGTHDLLGLWRARRHGVRVVQRLDGMNWIHRKKPTGLRHYLRAEYGNFILSTIRSRLASQIIYQSEFSHQWWERAHGKSSIPWNVVHNGVDLERYTPNGAANLPTDRMRLLLVEGTIGSGYELGLEIAVHLGERLITVYHRNVEIMVVGRTSAELQREWKNRTHIPMKFTGEVPADKIPEIDRSAHVLYAADVNPACPNSVIEAMACGLPVAAFDTGALNELITNGAGEVVPYGGDPWRLDPPDIEGLANAVNIILDNQARYRIAARDRAEQAFGLHRMVESYLNVLVG
jgi:glycosyltransferase involved in cell wall biosynthesis